MSAENTNAGGGETEWHLQGRYVYRNEYGAVGYVNDAGSNPGLITVVGVSGAEAEAVASRIYDVLTRWSATDKSLWRTGQHYGIHVYEGDRPVATFHRPEDAAWAVTSVNDRSDAALSAQSTGSGGVAAEPVAWAYEEHKTYAFDMWEHALSYDKPEPASYHRNIRPLGFIDEHPPVAAEPVAGWKLVPVEPTRAMQEAGGYACQENCDMTFRAARLAYTAMLAAAPTPPAGGGETLQADLCELLMILGMGDHARPQSPHEVFQHALSFLKGRLALADEAFATLRALYEAASEGAFVPEEPMDRADRLFRWERSFREDWLAEDE